MPKSARPPYPSPVTNSRGQRQLHRVGRCRANLTMTSDTTVTATSFPVRLYTLTIVIAGGDGTVIPTPSKTEYGYNEGSDATAQPAGV